MARLLMKCGHVANATDANGNPCCAICAGIDNRAFEIAREVKGTDGLEGRKAKCPYCGKTVDSKWELPFFEYCPDVDRDSYYCGCWGWD